MTERISGPHTHKVHTTPPAVLAAGTPVTIDALEQKFCWPKGGWQDSLLRAADQAGNKDGKVTASEIDAYLANPTDTKFLTSTALSKLAQDTGTGKTIAQLPTTWEQTVAKSADTNHDGKLDGAELGNYLDAIKCQKDGAANLWMPDQKAAMFDSSVKDLTGEADMMRGANVPGMTLEKNYMRIVEDTGHKTPNMVSYTLTAADQFMTPKDVSRKNNFHADKDYKDSPSKDDYDNSGFDRGHQKPAEDSPNMEAMNETFLMTNMAPQTKMLNEQSWKYLEEATREAVNANGGKATIVTGSLYLGDDGKPLPPEKLSYIGPKGEKEIAVPSHSFKTVVMQTPDGKTQAFAFVVPNQQNLPTNAHDIQQLLLKSRVSIADIEKDLGGGANLYAGLPPDVAKAIKNDNTASIPVPDPQHHPVATMIFQPGQFQKVICKQDEAPPEAKGRMMIARNVAPAHDGYGDVEKLMSNIGSNA